MSELICITSLEHLVDLCRQHKPLRCFIQLNYGARSVKRIRYKPRSSTFSIHNEIDGSRQELHADDLMNPEHGNIGPAIQAGAFFAEV
jgi:hypothetical protein